MDFTFQIFQYIKKVSSYIPQYPVVWIAQSTLHFTIWQTYSIKHHLNFSGKHLATMQLMCTTIYSQVLIHTASQRFSTTA